MNATKPKINVVLNNITMSDTDKEDHQYIQLCRGKDLRSQKVQSRQYCKYEHRNIPYYRLKKYPFKF